MLCPRCGALNDDSAKSCGSCKLRFDVWERPASSAEGPGYEQPSPPRYSLAFRLGKTLMALSVVFLMVALLLQIYAVEIAEEPSWEVDPEEVYKASKWQNYLTALGLVCIAAGVAAVLGFSDEFP